ncbi:helix-turn-helix domain-containing protein [Leptothrix sp. BB-4]
MTRYRQLQPEERVTLSSVLQWGHGLRSIAKALERNSSSVSREVSRNGGADEALGGLLKLSIASTDAANRPRDRSRASVIDRNRRSSRSGGLSVEAGRRVRGGLWPLTPASQTHLSS